MDGCDSRPYLVGRLRAPDFRKRYLNIKRDLRGGEYSNLLCSLKERRFFKMQKLQALLEYAEEHDRFVANILKSYIRKLKKTQQYKDL